MSKQEWRAACERTLNRLDNLKAEVRERGLKPKHAEGQKPKTR
jgi:hypothetical protein